MLTEPIWPWDSVVVDVVSSKYSEPNVLSAPVTNHLKNRVKPQTDCFAPGHWWTSEPSYQHLTWPLELSLWRENPVMKISSWDAKKLRHRKQQDKQQGILQHDMQSAETHW